MYCTHWCHTCLVLILVAVPAYSAYCGFVFTAININPVCRRCDEDHCVQTLVSSLTILTTCCAGADRSVALVSPPSLRCIQCLSRPFTMSCPVVLAPEFVTVGLV